MTADVSKATCDILLACAQKAETVSIFYLIDLGWEDFNFIPQTQSCWLCNCYTGMNL